MSSTAYRVIEIKTAGPSFNSDEDQELVDFLDIEADFYETLRDGGGMPDVPVKVLRKALHMREELHLSEKTVARLKEDISAAKAQGDESVTYSYF